VTHNGGTANGVAYLNGSKVLTTGSALTFDGTGLGVGVSPSVARVYTRTAAATGTAFQADNGVNTGFVVRFEPNTTLFGNDFAQPLAFLVNNSEQMRLTGTGLGIGTSSPAVYSANSRLLQIDGGANAAEFKLTNSTTGSSGADGTLLTVNGSAFYLWNLENSFLSFGTNNLDRGRITAGGNWLLGTTTDAGRLTVNGNIRTLGGNIELDTGQVTTNSSSNPLILGVNGTERARFTGNGEFLFATTTANAKVKLSLTSPGTLGTVTNVGSFGPGGVLSLGGVTNNTDGVYFGTGDTGGTGVASGIGFLREGSGWNSAVAFYTNNVTSGPNGVSAIREVGRFDSAGSWLVGTSTNPGNKAVFYGTGGTTIRVADDTNTNFRGYVIGATIADSAEYAYLKLNANSGELRHYVGPNSYGGFQTFFTSGAERARIDSNGLFLVNLSSAPFNTWKATFDGGSNEAIGAIANTAASFSYVAWNKATSGDNRFAGFFTEGTITERGSISFNRTAGLVSYNTTSDYRAKDISGPVVDSGTVIDSVPVYMGKMKGATQERPMFIAHETPAYAHTGEKDAVDAKGNPTYQQMDASALVPILWAEVQSLRKRLAAAGI